MMTASQLKEEGLHMAMDRFLTYLAERSYLPHETIRLNAKGWAERVRKQPFRTTNGTELFLEMRWVLRSLDYDDTVGWVNRRIAMDKAGRKWLVTMIDENGWWMLARNPENGNHGN